MSSADEHGGLERGGGPPALEPHEEPPQTTAGREQEWTADHSAESRDIRPALGTRGEPGPWEREAHGSGVAMAQPGFADARWSYLYKAADTRYAAAEPAAAELAAANRRMRSAPLSEVSGPFIKAPVWTWEVPVYFWVGGTASGAAFVASACDAAGDRRSARIARTVALTAVMPAPLLLIADLGRPERFLNMLRIFKPRSPMSMGAWCLVVFSGLTSAAVGADLLRRPRAAAALGALSSFFGGYLGSYTGVLLACTSVPLWTRSRLLLGPIFVCTATATGAAATHLALVARGLPARHPTRGALRTLETAAISAELALSLVNERRAGAIARPLRSGTSGRMFRLAESAVLLGLAAQFRGRRGARRMETLASVLFLGGGLAFRFAWVYAGRASAADQQAAAAVGRGQVSLSEQPQKTSPSRADSRVRRSRSLPGQRLWGELVRRSSIAVERRL